MKRKLLLSIIGILIIGISLIIIYPSGKPKIIPVEKETNNSSFISMMIENEEGKYIEKTDIKFPSEGYIFNTEKSGCENGGTLSWNSEKQKIEASLITSDKCYAYFDRINPLEYVKMTNISDSISKELIANLYRYQGVALEEDATNELKLVNDNYICINSNGCNGKNDKNMYRIIGITFDGNLKIIKNSALELYEWYDNNKTDVPWIESKIYNFLNNDNNSFFNSLGEFKSKILQVDWPYGYIGGVTDGIGNNGLEIYEMESGQKDVPIYRNIDGEWVRKFYKWNTKVKDYIGLMYLSDYYLSLSNEAICRDNGCKISWLHIGNNDNNLIEDYREWVLDLEGYDIDYKGYYGWYIFTTGRIYANSLNIKSYIRPVFYLNNNILLNGKGTIDNPYIVL